MYRTGKAKEWHNKNGNMNDDERGYYCTICDLH